MQVSQFLEKQTYLGITNSSLTNNTKVNETLLDYVYVSLEDVKKNSGQNRITCNVIISEIPNPNTIHIKMSGDSYMNSRYCYDTLKYSFNEKKNNYSGSSITKESDYYRISIGQQNTSTPTNTTSVSTGLTKGEDPTKSSSELEREMAKIVYRSTQDRYGSATTNEAIEYKENLLEEINKIKKIMII